MDQLFNINNQFLKYSKPNQSKWLTTKIRAKTANATPEIPASGVNTLNAARKVIVGMTPTTTTEDGTQKAIVKTCHQAIAAPTAMTKTATTAAIQEVQAATILEVPIITVRAHAGIRAPTNTDKDPQAVTDKDQVDNALQEIMARVCPEAVNRIMAIPAAHQEIMDRAHQEIMDRAPAIMIRDFPAHKAPALMARVLPVMDKECPVVMDKVPETMARVIPANRIRVSAAMDADLPLATVRELQEAWARVPVTTDKANMARECPVVNLQEAGAARPAMEVNPGAAVRACSPDNTAVKDPKTIHARMNASRKT
jgi:hypothetical protein